MKPKITSADIAAAKTHRLHEVPKQLRRAMLFPPADITELRLQNGLTQTEQALSLQISRQTCQGWESGTILPSDANLRKLHQLKATTEYIQLPGPQEIKQTRLAYSMAIEDFATHYSVSAATVQRWESGKSTPAPKILRQLAEALATAKELNLI